MADWQLIRERMVEEQLSARGIQDPDILRAFATVPRHELLPSHFVDQAYTGAPIPLEPGRRLASPHAVAAVMELAELCPGQEVLELDSATGSGLAYLASLGCRVWGTERSEASARQTSRNLARVGLSVVPILVAESGQVPKGIGPFDAIVSTVAMDEVPARLLEHLKEDGRLVVPVGSGESVILTRTRLGTADPIVERAGGGEFGFLAPAAREAPPTYAHPRLSVVSGDGLDRYLALLGSLQEQTSDSIEWPVRLRSIDSSGVGGAVDDVLPVWEVATHACPATARQLLPMVPILGDSPLLGWGELSRLLRKAPVELLLREQGAGRGNLPLRDLFHRLGKLSQSDIPRLQPPAGKRGLLDLRRFRRYLLGPGKGALAAASVSAGIEVLTVIASCAVQTHALAVRSRPWEMRVVVPWPSPDDHLVPFAMLLRELARVVAARGAMEIERAKAEPRPARLDRSVPADRLDQIVSDLVGYCYPDRPKTAARILAAGCRGRGAERNPEPKLDDGSLVGLFCPPFF